MLHKIGFQCLLWSVLEVHKQETCLAVNVLSHPLSYCWNGLYMVHLYLLYPCSVWSVHL